MIMQEEILNRLTVFAEEMLEKHFEKPVNKQYWRQQLKCEFKPKNKMWFGNLYFNGGKRVEISWDNNCIFMIELYQLEIGIKEKVMEEFTQLLNNLNIDCFLLKKIDTLEHVMVFPFGQHAAYFSDVLSNFIQLSYYPFHNDSNSSTFICVKQKEERIPIFLSEFTEIKETKSRQKRIIITN